MYINWIKLTNCAFQIFYTFTDFTIYLISYKEK